MHLFFSVPMFVLLLKLEDFLTPSLETDQKKPIRLLNFLNILLPILKTALLLWVRKHQLGKQDQAGMA